MVREEGAFREVVVDAGRSLAACCGGCCGLLEFEPPVAAGRVSAGGAGGVARGVSVAAAAAPPGVVRAVDTVGAGVEAEATAEGTLWGAASEANTLGTVEAPSGRAAGDH